MVDWQPVCETTHAVHTHCLDQFTHNNLVFTEIGRGILTYFLLIISSQNGRQPQYFGKWKTTSIFWQMEDDLNILEWKINLTFWLAPASTEFGTTQPQLVLLI